LAPPTVSVTKLAVSACDACVLDDFFLNLINCKFGLRHFGFLCLVDLCPRGASIFLYLSLYQGIRFWWCRLKKKRLLRVRRQIPLGTAFGTVFWHWHLDLTLALTFVLTFGTGFWHWLWRNLRSRFWEKIFRHFISGQPENHELVENEELGVSNKNSLRYSGLIVNCRN